jgi:biotin carboxyl carrier protein
LRDRMELEFLVADVEHKLSVVEDEGVWRVAFGDVEIRAEVVPVEPNVFWVRTSEGSSVVCAAESEGKLYAFIAGRQYLMQRSVREVRRRTGSGGTLKAGEIVESPMPGVIVKVPVGEGDLVEAGQVLVVVESMKMENGIQARGQARVKTVHVKAGDSVGFGSPLVELEPVAAA